MNERRFYGLLKHWDFILIDILCLQVSYTLAYRIISKSWQPYSDPFYSFEAILLSFSQVVVILFFTHYHGILRRKQFDEILSVCSMTGEFIVLMLVFLFLVHNTNRISRLQTGTTVLIYVALDYLLRQLNKIRVKKVHSDDSSRKNLVLFTSAALVPTAKERLYNSDIWRDFHISRIILFDESPDKMSEYQGIPVSAIRGEVIWDLSHQWVDEIFILQPDTMVYPASLINTFVDMGITVNFTQESFANVKWQNLELRKLGGYLVAVNNIRLITPGEAFIKRMADIFGGLIGCFVTGILALFIGPAIKRADPGPVFFGQERIGQNGRHFKLYKFRSMYMDAEERKAEYYSKSRDMDRMMFKLSDDPRIIGSKKKDGKPGVSANSFVILHWMSFHNFIMSLKARCRSSDGVPAHWMNGKSMN